MFYSKPFKLLLLLLWFIIKTACLFSQYSCPDTSFRKLLKEDSTAYFWNERIIKSNDGNIFIPSYFSHGAKEDGYLIKTSFNGNVIWAKRTVTDLNMGLETVHETNDGGLLLIGEMNIPMPYNGRLEMVLLKLNNAGSVQWFRTYKSTYLPDTTTGSLTIKDIVEDTDGSFFITAYNWVTSNNLPSVIKFSSTGDMIWHRGFAIGFYPWAFGLNLRNNEIRLVETTLTTIPNTNTSVMPITIITLNKMTGNVIGTKAFYPPYANSYRRSLSFKSDIMTKSNGNIVVYGIANDNLFNSAPPGIIHHAMVEFDPNFVPIKSYVFKSDEPGFKSDFHMAVFEDGSGFFLRSRYIDLTSRDLLVGKFNNGIVGRERIIETRGTTQHASASNFVTGNNGANFFTRIIFDNTSSWNGIELYNIHDSDTSGFCLGRDTMFTRMEEQSLTSVPISIDSIYNSFIVETHRQFTGIVDEQINNTNNCEDHSICDTIKIHGTNTTCIDQQQVSFTAYKNAQCGAWITWRIDTSVIGDMVLVNDTSIALQFNQNWQGFLYAEIQTSCGILKDSIFITVFISPRPVHLGPDSTLCPNNTRVLHAGGGYLSYLWQDGSTDSTFTITAPGTYWVQTSDPCNNLYRDTIIISTAPPILFDLGTNLSKCNSDSISITAPTDFINYSWSPNYNISNTTNQSVFVFPTVDTMYKVTAEKTPGCFAYDSVRIDVNNSLPIYLGADTSFCSGDSVVLNAGNGFVNYLWSTGSSSSILTVRNAGLYSVIATDLNNCKSKDTLGVLNVYANPVISFPADGPICSGTNLILNAGAGFRTYNWNTGAITNSININTAGNYWVNVTDNNGCKGTDTISITALLPLPSGFLEADTSICSYSNLQLIPLSDFKNYLWNNGNTGKTIIVSQPGTYWLQVTDNNDCKGRDTIIVNPKQCMEGFYIPGAFTPNNDGKNDDYKPFLFGKVISYRFIIYNRWGQKVFETTELSKGWNGDLASSQQNANVFVWQCFYQFENKDPEYKKGTVLLIK